MKIAIINGPNLNALGMRETTVYGSETLAELEREWQDYGRERGIEISVYQSNLEGEILNYLYATREETDGYILNPGALTHYSYALRDAIAAIQRPVVEVHISNVDNREEFRKLSVVTPVAAGKISGFGKTGYLLAIDYFAHEAR